MADLQALADSVIAGKRDDVAKMTKAAVDEGVSPADIINDGLIAGMAVVGEKFKNNEFYVPEVLIAARAMHAGMDIIKPLLAKSGVQPRGTVAIGTVKGDLHDIGKNLVAMMLEGAGFEVFDLGINTDIDAFLAAIDEHQPDIIGMSALLTTTMPYMKVVIDTLKERGLRDKYVVLVGGAPLNEEFGSAIGADAYCRDAAVAAETAKALVSARRDNSEPPGPSVA